MTETNKLLAVVKYPGENAEITEVGSRLKSLGKIVGGHVNDVVYSDCVVFYNMHGKHLGLDLNTTFRGLTYVGPIVVLGHDTEDLAELCRQKAHDIAVALDKGTVGL